MKLGLRLVGVLLASLIAVAVIAIVGFLKDRHIKRYTPGELAQMCLSRSMKSANANLPY